MLASIMPSVVPATTATRERVLRRERDRGDLGLVPHLQQKERDEGGSEHAEPRRGLFFIFVTLSGIIVHAAIAMNESQYPAHRSRAYRCSEPGTHHTGQRMIRECRDKNAQDDGDRLAELRGQYEREQLRLSPISASATTPVEIRKASIEGSGSGGTGQ